MSQLDTEFENCRTAWLFSVAHGRTQLLARSALTLLSFCEHRGRSEEGLAFFRDAVDAPRARDDAKFVALILAAMAQLQYRLDRYGEAEATAKRALAQSRATRDHDTRLQCFRTLGAICIRLERHADARRYFKQGLLQAPPGTYPRNGAVMLGNLALVEKAMGRYDESQRMSVQSMEQYRRLGDVAGEAVCLGNLGTLHMDRGDNESAAVYLKSGLELCDRHGLVSSRGLILANLTELALKTGDLDMAEAHGRRAFEVAQLTGNRAVESWLRLQFSRIALRRDDLTGARTELRASVEIAIAIGRPSHKLAGVFCFAEILEAQGEPDCARAALAFAAAHPSLTVLGRDEIRERLAQWGPGTGAPLQWPDLGLDQLIHRIVVEASVGHAPLIASIRG